MSPRDALLARVHAPDTEVPTDRAADATVHHLDELLLHLHLCILGEQRVIDADLAKLVLDDRNSLAVRRLHREESCVRARM